jgi:TRAP-type C4-dicarboxylate transport system permease small subunit
MAMAVIIDTLIPHRAYYTASENPEFQLYLSLIINLTLMLIFAILAYGERKKLRENI